LALATTAHAQWDIQDSGTTASLRGIATPGPGIAWASGTNGTVLRTTDTGKTWQHCTIPPDAEHLDFRGIQAFDANTAIVMSSGRAIYRGCIRPRMDARRGSWCLRIRTKMAFLTR
jgi:photosystem II stability/assembly factor-like uncharacterized protein